MPNDGGNPESRWKYLGERRTLYQDDRVHVVQDGVVKPNGAVGEYTYFRSSGESAFIVPVTSENPRRVVLIVGDRYLTGVPRSLEIPAGYPKRDEDWSRTASRELWEETGYEAGSVRLVGRWQAANALTDEWAAIVIAEGLRPTNRNEQKEEGIKEVQLLTWLEVSKAIGNGEISDALSIAALYRAAAFLGEKI